jgi:hypothetical protein
VPHLRLTAAALVVLLAAVACSEGDVGPGSGRRAAEGTNAPLIERTTTTQCLEPAEGGGCRRLPFAGDRNAAAQAGAMALRARQALAPLADRPRPPSVTDVERALADALPERTVQASDNAVGPAATAFGVAIPGGCLYGRVALNQVQVEVGGTVTTGGCLATNR